MIDHWSTQWTCIYAFCSADHICSSWPTSGRSMLCAWLGIVCLICSFFSIVCPIHHSFTAHSGYSRGIHDIFRRYSRCIQNIPDLFWEFILDICSGHSEYPVNYSPDYSCFSQSLFLVVYTAHWYPGCTLNRPLRLMPYNTLGTYIIFGLMNEWNN